MEYFVFLTSPSREDPLELLEIKELYLKEFHDLWYKEYLLSLREPSGDLFQVDYDMSLK